MSTNIKAFLLDDVVYFGVLLVLVALTSYGLGQQSMLSKPLVSSETNIALVSDGITSQTTVQKDEIMATNVELVASKSGSKYHFLWCTGAKQIKEENKVYFDSFEAARAAGYTPAANCDGLQ